MDVSTLSDEELNKAVLWVVNNPDCGEIDTKALGYGFGSSTLNYLTDWSLTGPLMVDSEIDLFVPRKRWPGCKAKAKHEKFIGRAGGHDRYKTVTAYHLNPLRAICECILMIEMNK